MSISLLLSPLLTLNGEDYVCGYEQDIHIIQTIGAVDIAVSMKIKFKVITI